MSDIIVSSQLDTSTWLRDASRAAQSLPTIRFKVDSRPLGIISGQISEFQKSLQAASARTLAFSFTAGQIYTVVRAFQAVFKSMVDVEKQLVDINSILGLSQNQLKKFSGDLFKVASETGTSFKVAAEGAVELSRQGLSATETLKRLKDSLTLTRLSGLGAADSVTAITTAINSFNKEALDSTQIINKLANVDAQFAVSSNDLAQALSKVGSAAADQGVSFDKLLGLVTSTRQITGQSGAIIGNALRGIFQRINKPEVLSQLKEYGVLVEDLSGNSLNADQILQNLGKAYDGLSQSQQKQVVSLGAGIYRSNQFIAILKDLASQNSITSRATDAAANSTDQAARRQQELNKTMASSINETINNLTNAASKIGKLTLAPALKVVIDGKAGIPGVKDFAASIAKEGDDQGQSVGGFIGTGILKGIGNYLSGPGLVLGGVLIARLFAQFAGFAAKSLAQIIEVTSSRYQAEQAIAGLLKQEPALIAQINAAGNDTARIQNIVNDALLRRNVLLNEEVAIRQKILGLTASSVGAKLVSNSPFILQGEQIINNPRRKAAVGLVPAISETLGAYAGGYQPGAIKELNIKGLGNVIYNTAEKVKNFPGFSQPAIIPPQSSKAGINYNKSFIQAHGFSPYKSEGMIPNYARNFGKMLGSGAFGEFYDFQRQFLGVPIGKKQFGWGVSPSSIENEYKMSKFLEGVDIGSLFKFPKVIGSLERAKKANRIGKEVISGETPYSFSRKVGGYRAEGFIQNLNLYAEDLLKLQGIRPSDFAMNSSNSILNPKAQEIIAKITSNRDKYQRLQKKLSEDPDAIERIAIAMGKQGARIGVIDPGLFSYKGGMSTIPVDFKSNGLIPNFMPQINRAQLEILLKDSQFAKKLKSFTYTNAKGETKDYSIGQYRVRRDKLVGAPAPGGHPSWTAYDNATNTLALYVQRQGMNEPNFKRFGLGGFKQLRAEGETFDVMNRGLVPNYASLAQYKELINYNDPKIALRRKLEVLNKKITPRSLNDIAREQGYIGTDLTKATIDAGKSIGVNLEVVAGGTNVPKINSGLPPHDPMPASPGQYGFWISPTGKMYPVAPYQHYSTAQGIIKKRYPDIEAGYPYEVLMERGWWRIQNGTDYVNIENYNKKGNPPSAILNEVTKYAVNTNRGIRNDSPNVKKRILLANPNYSEDYSRGLIPNYNALSNAILREKNAGIPLNQIRVGSSPRIQSHLNPLGLGVYNTRDEPGGLQQGINRVASMGLDPKRAGIPNYAFGGDFDKRDEAYIKLIARGFSSQPDLSPKGQQYFANVPPSAAGFGIDSVVKNVTKEVVSFSESLKSQIRAGTISSRQISKAIAEFVQDINLADKSAKILQRNIEQSVRYYKKPDKPQIREQLSGFVSGNQLSFGGLPFGDIGLFGNNQGSSQGEFIGITQQAEIENRKKASRESVRNIIKNGLSPSLVSTIKYGTTGKELGIDQFSKSFYDNQIKETERRRLLNAGSRNSLLLPLLQNGTTGIGLNGGTDRLKEAYGLNNILSGGGLIERLTPEIKKRAELQAKAEFDAKLATTEKFQSKVNSLYGFGVFKPGIRDEARRTGQDAVYKESLGTAQNRALTASFVLPLLAGLAQQSADTIFGDKSANARGLSRTVGGLGNVASFTATGLGIGGLTGAGVGLGLGILSELPATIKAFTDTLPDLQRNLEKITEVSQKTSTSFQSFITTSQQLRDIQTGEIPSTIGQRNALERQRNRALIGIPLEARQRLIEAEKSGDFGEVARIADVETNKVEQRRLFVGDLGNLISTSKSQPKGFKAAFNTGFQFGQEGTNEFYEKSLIGKILAPAGTNKAISRVLGLGSGAVYGTGALFSNFSERLGLGRPTGKGFKASIANAIFSGVDVQNQQNTIQTRNQVRPFIESILNLTDREGNTLLKTLTPQEIRNFQSQNAKGFEFGKNQLRATLSSRGIDPTEYINALDLANKEVKEAFQKNANSIIDEKFINRTNENNRKIEKVRKDFEISLDSFSKKILDLSTSGREAVNKFEINILGRLSESLTKIEIGGLNRRFSNQETLIGAGDNQYLKNFLELQNARQTGQESFQKGSLQSQAKFSKGIADFITDASTDFLSRAKIDISQDLTKKDSDTVKKLTARRQEILSSVLRGFATITDDQFSLNRKNFNEQDALEIRKRVNDETKKLDENKVLDPIISVALDALRKSKTAKTVDQLTGNEELFKRIRGIPSGEKQAELLFSDISQLEKMQINDKDRKNLIENLRAINKEIDTIYFNRQREASELLNDLISTNQKAEAEFAGNKRLLGREFAVRRGQNRFQSDVGVELIGAQSRLGIRKLTESPFQQLQTETELQRIRDESEQRLKLNQQIPDLRLGNIGEINAEAQKRSLANQFLGQIPEIPEFLGFGGFNDAIRQQIEKNTGEIIRLTEASQALNDKDRERKEILEAQTRELKLQLAFSENRASALRTQNIGKAAAGQTFSRRELGESFVSELQYNTNDFWRDMSTNAQDFGKDFRESFKSGFREAITGAKSFTEALRGIGINIASSFLTKASDLAISSLLGGIFNQKGTAGPLAGFLGLKEKGGYIPKLAKGGFVNMGSGIKDDVPAFLSGGEFVLNKRAVSRIGKHNLDRINFSQGNKQPRQFLRPEENQFSGAVLSDHFDLSGNSAIIKLANTLEVNKFGRDPRMNVSPLLSSYGLTDENNPQNKLRFAREKWIFERKQFDKQVEDARKKFNDQQVTSLVTSYLTAGINAVAMGSGPKGVKGGFDYQGNGSQFAGYAARGGYIPKFNRGGYFGGDMAGDRLAAMIQGGEYVVGPKTVSNYGTSYFNSLNKMQAGGYVGGSYSNNDLSDNISKLISINEQIRDKLNTPINQNNQQPQQGGGNVFNINISTSLNSDGSVKNTQTDVKSNNNQNQNTINDKDAMVKLSGIIRTKVIEVINQESKGGGILSEKFASRR